MKDNWQDRDSARGSAVILLSGASRKAFAAQKAASLAIFLLRSMLYYPQKTSLSQRTHSAGFPPALPREPVGGLGVANERLKLALLHSVQRP